MLDRCACPPTVRAARVVLSTRGELGLEAGPASTTRPGTSWRTLPTRLPVPNPGQPDQAHQDDDYEKLHTVIFFRSWLQICSLRGSARYHFPPYGSGAAGSRIPRPPSPSNLDRSSKSKRAQLPPPVDSVSDVVGWLAWLSPSRCLRCAFTTDYTMQSSLKTSQYLVIMQAITKRYRSKTSK